MHPFSISAGGVCFVSSQSRDVDAAWWQCGDWGDRQDAAIRELKEESGLEAEIVRLVGLHSGKQERKEGIQSSLYVVFEMKAASGVLKGGGYEIADLKYWDIPEAIESDRVVKLSK